MSALVSVRRSPMRTVLTLLAGILLLLAAYDITRGHVISGSPTRQDVPEDQVEVSTTLPPLTTKGESERRTDLLWGTVFVMAGFATVVGAVVSLARRPSLVEVGEDSLRLRIAGPGALVAIPWEHVDWVHSGVSDDDEATPARVLLVHVDDPEDYPRYPWGAIWDGATLMMDADSWNMPPEDVVNHARIALGAHRREAEAAAEAGIQLALGDQAPPPVEHADAGSEAEPFPEADPV